MTTRIDLAVLPWTLRGWRMNDWELGASFARLEEGRPDVDTVPAQVPGSVRGALVRSGVVPDAGNGLASRESEWIENRHWSFATELPEVDLPEGSRVVLVADSLDYAGIVLLGEHRVGTFTGSMVTHEFDLTEAWSQGSRWLTIVFTDVPADLGQIGWTSRIREFKARYNYGWDWTPRVVQIGVAGPLHLEVRDARISELFVHAEYGADAAQTQLHLKTTVSAPTGHSLRLILKAPDGALGTLSLDSGEVSVSLADLGFAEIHPWRLGDGVLYALELELRDADGVVRDTASRRVGFRTVHWRPVQGAPADAEPWILEVNGERTFIAGVNWVPVRPDYADVTEDDIRLRFDEYRRIGVNLLRVWGGAAREQDAFYDLADEFGFALWQELPLSSSGLDNMPPQDEAFVTELTEIAEEYARRLHHHPCLVLWGGGNELIDETTGTPVPLTDAHPAIAAARDVLAQRDPGRRFVATSPTGPSVWGDPSSRGQGVHHDVHGPWESGDTFEQWRAYWDEDDALMRSEVGMGGASSLELLERHGLLGPTDTPQDRANLIQLWSHSSAWWLGPLKEWDGAGGLAAWVEGSRRRQAEWLAYAARVSRDRFPRCGGFIVWLGHDTFPCAVSLALLDADGAPKPAAEALGRVFRGED